MYRSVTVVVCVAALLAGHAVDAFVVKQPRAGCTISVNNGLGATYPLILRDDASADSVYAFWLPSENDDRIRFDDGDVAHFACPGGDLRVSGSSVGASEGVGTCVDGRFEIAGKSVSMSSITCSRWPFHTARYTGASCNGDVDREIEVGFELDGGRFVRHLTICFDAEHEAALWSRFDLPGAIDGYESGFPRPDFIQDDFYTIGNVDQLYSRNTQRAAINALVGLSSGDTKYVASSGDYFLSRGHLTAKADFVFGVQHRLTFHFVNVAPQWQTFNGANWNTLEQDVRAMAGSRDQDLVVYTGGHGVATLPHAQTGEEQELYLYTDKATGKQALPVPAVYYKVLYDEATQRGIAFVGINNPYATDTQQYRDICADVCDQVSWLHWDKNSVQKGISWCCDVDELRKTVTELPDFPVSGLLV